MDEEQKKGITIVVGSTERRSKSMLVAALSKIEDVKVLVADKDHVTINPSLIKEIDESFAAKFPDSLPGLGFGLMTDTAGIPLGFRPKAYVPNKVRSCKRKSKHPKRK
jgi:hypothetical protein